MSCYFVFSTCTGTRENASRHRCISGFGACHVPRLLTMFFIVSLQIFCSWPKMRGIYGRLRQVAQALVLLLAACLAFGPYLVAAGGLPLQSATSVSGVIVALAAAGAAGGVAAAASARRPRRLGQPLSDIQQPGNNSGEWSNVVWCSCSGNEACLMPHAACLMPHASCGFGSPCSISRYSSVDL